MKIKNILTVMLAMVVVWTPLVAQQVNYQKADDNPDEAIEYMLNIAPLEAHISTGKYTPTSGMIGINGVYGFTKRIGFEAHTGVSYFNTKAKGISYLQAGAFVNLFNKETTKDTKVVLGYKRNHDVLTTTETYRFIQTPARFRTSIGVRAGIQHNASHVETDGIKIAAALSKFTLSGVYLGVQSTSKHLIKTQLAGEAEPTPTGAIYKLFADVLVYPVSKIADPFLAASIKTGHFGARAGILWVQNPYGRKHNTSRYNAFLGRMNMALEAGMRPVDNFYVKGGVYWGLIYR